MPLFNKMHRFTGLIPALAAVMGIATGCYAEGGVNCSVYARDATRDSDGNLTVEPVKICSSDNFIGWIKPGTWICFSQFDFGTGPVFIEIEGAGKKKGRMDYSTTRLSGWVRAGSS